MGRAIFFTEPGRVEVLKIMEVEDKAVADDEVLVQHTAIGVNYIDTQFRSGKRAISGTNKIIGYEACGIVKAVGKNVPGFAVGSRVGYATAPLGAYRESRCINHKYLVAIPDNIDDKTAAASLFKGLTAHYLISRTFIVKPGHFLLVHSATSGVAHLLCQWASSVGAVVIGTVDSDDKKQLALESGCQYVFNMKTEDWAEESRKITNGIGVNAVYDFVGKDTFEGSIKALMKFGLLALVDATSGIVSNISYNAIALKSIFLTVPSLFDYKENRMELAIGASDLFNAIQEGKLNVMLGGTYSLEKAGEAHAFLESDKNIGSTILIP